MHTWVATVGNQLRTRDETVEVAASNLTTALKRVVEKACPEYGPRRGYFRSPPDGGKLPPGNEVLVIHIRRLV
ncbi:MAG: hypothetical protein Q8O76_08440 [Chloroflexota bacterium]|nr:hypothetical protein [Chloroflexota bacterium]